MTNEQTRDNSLEPGVWQLDEQGALSKRLDQGGVYYPSPLWAEEMQSDHSTLEDQRRLVEEAARVLTECQHSWRSIAMPSVERDPPTEPRWCSLCGALASIGRVHVPVLLDPLNADAFLSKLAKGGQTDE